MISQELYDEVLRFIRSRVSSRSEAADAVEAEDICQIVFEHVVQKRETVSEKNLRAYCYATARRAIIDFYRARHRKHLLRLVPLPPEGVPDTERQSSDVEREASEARAEILSWIPGRIDGLPERYRTPLELSVRHEMSPQQVANALALTTSTAKVRLHRARRMLIRNIDACCRLLHDVTGRVVGYEPRTIRRKAAEIARSDPKEPDPPRCCA